MTVIFINFSISFPSPPPLPVSLEFHDLDGFSCAHFIDNAARKDRLARPVVRGSGFFGSTQVTGGKLG